MLMRTLNRSCLSTPGSRGHGEVAAEGQGVFGTEVEDLPGLPDLVKGGIDRDFPKRYLLVGGDVELQIVARLVIGQRASRARFPGRVP